MVKLGVCLGQETHVMELAFHFFPGAHSLISVGLVEKIKNRMTLKY